MMAAGLCTEHLPDQLLHEGNGLADVLIVARTSTIQHRVKSFIAAPVSSGDLWHTGLCESQRSADTAGVYFLF